MVERKTALTCVSGVGVMCGPERGLSGSPGICVVSFGRGELSAVGLPKNAPDIAVPSFDWLNKLPCVPRTGAKGLPNKLLGILIGVLSCSPKSPPLVVGCEGAKEMLRLGAGDSPGLPSREGIFPSVDGALKRGVFVGSDVAFVDGVPRENGCIFDKSGLLFCDSGVFH